MVAKFAIATLLFVGAGLACYQAEAAAAGARFSAVLEKELDLIKASQEEVRAAVRHLREGSNCLNPKRQILAECSNSIKPSHELELLLASFDASYLPMIRAINQIKEGKVDLGESQTGREFMIELYSDVLLERTKHKNELVRLLESHENQKTLGPVHAAIREMIQKFETQFVDRYLEISA